MTHSLHASKSCKQVTRGYNLTFRAESTVCRSIHSGSYTSLITVYRLREARVMAENGTRSYVYIRT